MSGTSEGQQIPATRNRVRVDVSSPPAFSRAISAVVEALTAAIEAAGSRASISRREAPPPPRLSRCPESASTNQPKPYDGECVRGWRGRARDQQSASRSTGRRSANIRASAVTSVLFCVFFLLGASWSFPRERRLVVVPDRARSRSRLARGKRADSCTRLAWCVFVESSETSNACARPHERSGNVVNKERPRAIERSTKVVTRARRVERCAR